MLHLLQPLAAVGLHEDLAARHLLNKHVDRPARLDRGFGKCNGGVVLVGSAALVILDQVETRNDELPNALVIGGRQAMLKVFNRVSESGQPPPLFLIGRVESVDDVAGGNVLISPHVLAHNHPIGGRASTGPIDDAVNDRQPLVFALLNLGRVTAGIDAMGRNLLDSREPVSALDE